MNTHGSITSTVIIATRNRLNDILVCLESLSQQTEAATEIIVVDSSDVPLNQQAAFNTIFTAEHFPYSVCVYHHTGPGAAYQRNEGAKLATGQVLHFLDDDTKLMPTYIQEMNNVFAQNVQYGGGMGCVLNVGQKVWSLDRLLRCIFLLQRDYASGNFTWSGMPTHVYGTTEFKEIEVLGGCCMSYRAEVFRKYLFDEQLGRYSYMEDCDTSLRVSRTRLLFYHPGAQLYHYHSPASRDSVEDNRAIFIRNYSYLFFKNFYPRNKFKIFAYGWSVIGLFLQALLIRNRAYVRGYIKGLRWYYAKQVVRKGAV